MKQPHRYLVITVPLQSNSLLAAIRMNDESCSIDEVDGVAQAITQLAAHRYDCIFLNIRDFFGEDLAVLKFARVGEENPVPIACIIDEGYEQAAMHAMKVGMIDGLIKVHEGFADNIAYFLRDLHHHKIPVRDNKQPFLIVDDDTIDRRAVQRALSKTRFSNSCDEVTSAEEGLQALAREEYQCVFLDYNLPGINGMQFIEMALQSGYRAPIIVLISGRGSEKVAAEAILKGASAYIAKSDMSPELVQSVIAAALQKRFGEKAVRDYVRELERKTDRNAVALQ